MDSLVAQIVESFKTAYGLKITDSGDLFLTERNLLEFLMGLGRQAMNKVFQGMGNGYEGAVIYKGGRKYRFVGYRSTSLHGLFGMIEYKRAYYFSRQEGGGGYSPWIRSWASRSVIPPVANTFSLPSLGGKPTRKAGRGFTRSSAPTARS